MDEYPLLMLISSCDHIYTKLHSLIKNTDSHCYCDKEEGICWDAADFVGVVDISVRNDHVIDVW